uniref:Uncharacterized protein n=1 Tax=Anguilla anguilla TaxID=7936 RepID=A0A0E9PDW7_ANGAN
MPLNAKREGNFYYLLLLVIFQTGSAGHWVNFQFNCLNEDLFIKFSL